MMALSYVKLLLSSWKTYVQGERTVSPKALKMCTENIKDDATVGGAMASRMVEKNRLEELSSHDTFTS